MKKMLLLVTLASITSALYTAEQDTTQTPSVHSHDYGLSARLRTITIAIPFNAPSSHSVIARTVEKVREQNQTALVTHGMKKANTTRNMVITGEDDLEEDMQIQVCQACNFSTDDVATFTRHNFSRDHRKKAYHTFPSVNHF